MKEIKITKGKVALVDDADFDLVNQFKWQAMNMKGKFYAGREFKGSKLVLMHRFILNPPSGMCVDHKDGNALNNQRENIRICTRSQNSMNAGKRNHNTTGYKGVIRVGKVFRAVIRAKGKLIYLGSFKTALGAYNAYVKGCKKYHGEYANYG